MKNILITGASRGIGRAVALKMAEDKNNFYLLGRNEKKLNETCAEVIKRGSTATPVIVDISQPSEIENIVKAVKSDKLNILVNNAGTALVKPFEEISLEEWQYSINLNITAPFLLTQRLKPKLQSGSSIVNILSVASKTAFPGWSAYCMSKFALDGFMKTIREELRAENIRVINLYPGAIATDIWENVPGDWDKSKMMNPEKIAEAVYYAVSQPSNVLVEEITLTNQSGNQ